MRLTKQWGITVGDYSGGLQWGTTVGDYSGGLVWDYRRGITVGGLQRGATVGDYTSKPLKVVAIFVIA